jgi:hypothetical protein
MRPEGWIFIAISWGAILSLFAYCMVRILQQKNNKDQNNNDK